MNGDRVRTWPPGQPEGAAGAVSATCAGCGLLWQVDPVMAGFRLRCECGAWVDVPAPRPASAPADLLTQTTSPARDGDAGADVPAVVDERGWIREARALEGPDAARVPLQAPLGADALRHSSVENRARWTNRTLLEFGLLMVALLSPQLAIHLFADGERFDAFAPLASLAAGVLALPVIAWAGPFGVMGLRTAGAGFFAEALIAVPAWVVVAEGYRHLVESSLPFDPGDGLADFVRRLGLPAALFVIAATPAVLEELIFRGVLQGRLLALLGRTTGLVTCAGMFAVCHLNPLGMPILFAVGLHLGWLRERSQSLLPGMLLHALYNGTLVVLASR